MSSLSQAASSVEKRTNARYWIVVMLFIVTSFNYGDRATLSIAVRKWPKISALIRGNGLCVLCLLMGLCYQADPGGWLLDRFGSKRVYFWSIFIWSMFTLLQGFVDIFSGFGIIVALFTLRFWSGLLKRHLSPATVALLRPGFRRRKGERRCRFLTPLNTSQR